MESVFRLSRSASLSNSSSLLNSEEELKKPSFNPLTQFELGKRSGEAVKGLSRAAQKPIAKGKDKKAPKASLSLLGSVTGGSTYDFLVTYKDNKGIKAGSLGTGDILVAGNGFNQVASLVSKTSSKKGKVYNVVYQIVAPGGTWDAVDNGAYNISLQSRQVKDVSRNSAAARLLGTFPVDISPPPPPPPPPTRAPTARLPESSLFTGDSNTYDFTITYTDDIAIDAGSIDSNDITVVDRSGSIQQVEKVAVNGSGTSYTVTYRVKAPGGTWNRADNGSYDVTMQPNQVKDINGNAVNEAPLGKLQVDVLLRSNQSSRGSNSDFKALDFVLDVDASTGTVDKFQFSRTFQTILSTLSKFEFSQGNVKIATSREDLLSREEFNGIVSYFKDETSRSLDDSSLIYFAKFSSYREERGAQDPPPGYSYSSGIIIFDVKAEPSILNSSDPFILLDAALNGETSKAQINRMIFTSNLDSFFLPQDMYKTAPQ